MSKAPPFDQAILDKAKAKFIEELRIDIGVIEGYLQSKATLPTDEIAKIFHKIKGASGFLAMTQLESESSELVKAIRSSNAEHQQLVQLLSNWLATAKDICNKS